MKGVIKIVLIGFFIFTIKIQAQEQLPQLVTQLQKTPTDNALREKIIKLAVSMKPSPAVSDEALKYEGRAQFAFKNAKSEGDYVSAAQEYEKAVAAAPWVAGYYSDLCTIYEKAGKYAEAKLNCGFYLVSLTDPNEITDIKRRIAGLDYGIEQAAKAKAAADAVAKTELDKLLVEQTKRDVISKIKQIVAGRSYQSFLISYSGRRDDIFGGVAKSDIFGGIYYRFEGGCPMTWKFFDDYVELWHPWGEGCTGSPSVSIIGESWGPTISDMRWFNNVDKPGREPSRTNRIFTRTWAYFDENNGNLFEAFSPGIPLNIADWEAGRRYSVINLYRP